MERILLRKNFDTDKFLRKGMNYFRLETTLCSRLTITLGKNSEKFSSLLRRLFKCKL